MWLAGHVMCHSRRLGPFSIQTNRRRNLRRGRESRTEWSRHQPVSQAACDVIAAPTGRSLSSLLRHIRVTDSSTAVGWLAGWLAGCGRRLLDNRVSLEDRCQGNGYKWRGGGKQSLPRQKQINKQNKYSLAGAHVLVIPYIDS